MKLLKSTLILTLTLLLSGTVFGQQEQATDKKEITRTVIVKKTIDDDGNEVVEKIVREIDGEDMEDIQVWVEENAGDEKVVIKGIQKDLDIQEKDGEKIIKIVTQEGDDTDVNVWVVKEGEEIPAEAKELMEGELHFFHKAEGIDSDKGFLGVIMKKEVEVENIDGEETRNVKGVSEKGAYISEIVENSAAAEAGLQAGDIITALDGNTIADFDALSSYLSNKQKGDKVDITYLRGNQELSTNATLKGGKGKFVVKKIQESRLEETKDGNKIFRIQKDIEGEGSDGHKVVIIKRVKDKDGLIQETIEEKTAADLSPEMDVKTDRVLPIESINLFPNPSNGWVQVQFKAEAVPTTVRLVDINGKELFRQEIGNFDGNYNKAIDLTKAAKGTVVLTIQQGDKVYTDKIAIQ
jgi:hypothetical protein